MRMTDVNRRRDAAPGPLAGLHVLLAEDCPDQSRLFLRHLLDGGAQVALQCNGAAAVREVERSMRHARPFDAIVLDFHMPLLDGLEAVLAIRGLGYEWPVIGVTSGLSRRRIATWLRAGCTVCVLKPLSRERLVGAVAEAVWSAPRVAIAGSTV